MKRLLPLLLIFASLLLVSPASAADNSNRCSDLELIALKFQEHIADLTQISDDYDEMIGLFNQRIAEGRQIRGHLAEDFRTYSQKLKALGYRVKREGGKLQVLATSNAVKRGPKVEEAVAMVRASHRALLEIDRAVAPLVKDRAVLLKQRRQIDRALAEIEDELVRIEFVKSDLGCPID